mmetsp:Transcript_49647/g.153302  ORF Transcript_49647/g.153302 Transcript_49647/m.153302 type:complete len:256 (+) Transcript_49647:625-1392(+)
MHPPAGQIEEQHPRIEAVGACEAGGRLAGHGAPQEHLGAVLPCRASVNGPLQAPEVFVVVLGHAQHRNRQVPHGLERVEDEDVKVQVEQPLQAWEQARQVEAHHRAALPVLRRVGRHALDPRDVVGPEVHALKGLGLRPRDATHLAHANPVQEEVQHRLHAALKPGLRRERPDEGTQAVALRSAGDAGDVHGAVRLGRRLLREVQEERLGHGPPECDRGTQGEVERQQQQQARQPPRGRWDGHGAVRTPGTGAGW